METKQNTNDFAKGMTNIPSDNICPDDTTAAEYNLIFRDGEHRPIQAPVNAFEGQVEEGRYHLQLIYVHNYNDVKRCIFYDHKDRFIKWAFYNDVDTPVILLNSFEMKIEDIAGITSIGNTLIISLLTEGHSSLHYFLWKAGTSLNDSKYRFLGTKLPSPKFTFHLTASGPQKAPLASYTSEKYGSMVEVKDVGDGYYSIKAPVGKDEDMKTLLIGLYSKCKNEISKKGGFCLPLMIRYALKLFDGSYTYISIPQLMFPCVRRNVSFSLANDEIQAHMYFCYIIFKQTEDLSEWSDIIKNIAIFINNPTEVNDTSTISPIDVKTIPYDCVSTTTEISADGAVQSVDSSKYISKNARNIVNNFKMLSDEQIINGIIQSSVFYKICEIDIKPMSNFERINKYLRINDILNLTTLEKLDHDDYFSKCPLVTDNIFMYNKRLHLSNVKRGFCTELSDFSHITTQYERDIIPYVYITTSDGDYTVRCDSYTTKDGWGLYFYYPDPRAYKVILTDTRSGDHTELELKPHPLLNGAYYLKYLPTSVDDFHQSDLGTINPSQNYKFEELQNEVWVSEVNNPFVFNASGVNTVGNGSIIGIISNTTALSQGQFGQFPLICFTTDGIYALEVSSTGIYSSAHPLSREVCNNAKSIVATDHLVFFSSEKGLMMINGPQVTCVSNNLNGKTFFPTPQENQVMASNDIGLLPSLTDFLKQAMIAYDYRDNLLWILNPSHKLAYILSIDSGAYAITTLPYTPVAVVNDYPDTIIELKTDKTEEYSGIFYNIYETLSLINRPNINDDERRISSFIISRPMKIGDQNSLKTPTMIRYIGNNNRKAVIKLRLFASDDLMNWVRVNSLRGRGFKYYKYNIIFEDLLPTDTFSGVTERWQFRYQSKFR